jgi:hypothetical protein
MLLERLCTLSSNSLDMTRGNPLVLSIEYLPQNIQSLSIPQLDSLIHGNETFSFDECNACPQVRAYGSQYLNRLAPRQAVACDSRFHLCRESLGFGMASLDLVPRPLFVLIISEPYLTLLFNRL